MKHIKLFEQFINEAEKTERGKYHPEVETFVGRAGDDRVRTAFGIFSIFGSSAEYEMEIYNKINPANIKRAIKEVDQWLVIPKNKSRLKQFLAMFKTKNEKNLEDIYTYVTVGKSQQQLERKYKVKGFIAQAEVLSQITDAVNMMNLDPNAGVVAATLTLKDVQNMAKDLEKMQASLEKYEDMTEDGDGQERVDTAIEAIEDATLVIRAKIVGFMMDLEESVVIAEALKTSDIKKYVKTLEKYVSQLEALGASHGGDIADASNEAAELLETAADTLTWI